MSFGVENLRSSFIPTGHQFAQVLVVLVFLKLLGPHFTLRDLEVLSFPVEKTEIIEC